MKVCGLIAEYNPFHNGHIHHIKEAKRISGADYLVVVMSGNYVQRGTPAIIDKYERTRMALEGGADLILEIPTLFSTASAEIFACAAINLLDQIGVVDSFCFGSEAGNLEALLKIAKVLSNEPPSFSEDLKNALKAGMSYPMARATALELYFGEEIDNLSEILKSPNNILGIEYLKALKKLGSSMTPFTIPRWATEHNSFTTYKDVASATAIRNMLYEEDGVDRILPFVDSFTAREFALNVGVSTPVRANDFSMLLQYRLESEKDHLTDYFDFSTELADRVKNLLPDVFLFKEWAQALKTKAYTRSRINRALLHLILDIKEEDLLPYKDEDYCMYAKILGFRETSAPLLSSIKANTALPLISKMVSAKHIVSPLALKLLQKDVDSSNIYRNAVYQKFGTLLKNEYTAGIIKI